MNRLFIILLLLFGLLSDGFAQLIDTTYPPLTYINQLHVLNDTSSLFLANDGRLYKIDQTGKIVWATDYYDDGKAPWTSFVSYPADQDQLYYIVTMDDHCDYYYPQKLHTFNGEGEKIATEYFGDFPSLPMHSFIFPQLPGLPKYLIGEGGSFQLYYDEDSTTLVPDPHYSQIFTINSLGIVYVLVAGGISKLEFIHDSLILTASVPLNVSRILEWLPSTDSTIFICGKNEIQLYNSDLEVINEFTTASGENIYTYYWHEPFLVAEVRLSSFNYKYYIFDSNLNIQFTTTLPPLPDFQLFDVAWSKDSIFTLAGSEYYFSDKTYAFIKSMDFGASPVVHDQDVSLSGIKFKNVYVGPEHECYYSDTTRYFLIENATIEIANNGTDVIKSVTITPTKTYCNWWCDKVFQYFQQIDNMNLQPGQKKEFFLGDIPIERENRDSADRELCLMAILPDGHVDVDHADNLFCFDLTVGQVNIEDEDYPFFYPNPVKDILYVSSKEDLIELVIYNTEGKIVFRQVGIENDEVNVSSLASGLFFIQYLTKHGSYYTDRFVKI